MSMFFGPSADVLLLYHLSLGVLSLCFEIIARFVAVVAVVARNFTLR